ncbi:MAG: hypothetical protein K9I94_14940 [Bacteroidales bacterium]|nr:hypothetical protein [Bacteroidales bacterium]
MADFFNAFKSEESHFLSPGKGGQLNPDYPIITINNIPFTITVIKYSMKTIHEEKIYFFRNKLLGWYKEEGRSFPWRKNTASNYELIMAEIFLQRTKAETVANFLPRFFKKYPNWDELGKASEDEIKAFIKPLGLYKQKGKRIYELAQELRKRKGRFPKKRNEIEEIPMMGQYITNAYELYVLNKKSPLLDVNMARVLERFFGKRKKADIRYDPYLQNLAYNVVNINKSKELNWAVLDFAAKVCKIKPLCNLCIIKNLCTYYSKAIYT